MNKKITTGIDPDEGTFPWYARMWENCECTPGLENLLKNATKSILQGFTEYEIAAERLSAHPNFAYVLGAIHFKESGCDFRGVLHNGERIIGTGEKTKLVPIGRGPFKTWSESAVDAIQIRPRQWIRIILNVGVIGELLFSMERFNGLGYITGNGHMENSPYLWACSNINDGFGKYVSDGHFDPLAPTTKSPGAALILKEFWKMGVFAV